MCQDPITIRWFPAAIKTLCPETRSYLIETPEGVTYRRTQNHLKSSSLTRRPQEENNLPTNNQI